MAEPSETPLPTPETLDAPDQAVQASEAAARRVRKSVTRSDVPISDRDLPHISDDTAFGALPEGGVFYGADGKKRQKPYTIRDDIGFDALPEGAMFVGPDGKMRQKPKYEGIDFTAQTLYNMSVNDKERRRALEKSYPGKVRESAEGLWIDDGSVRRKPGRGVSAATGFAAGAAAPVTGAILGAVGGTAAGGFVGTAVGGAGGALLGQGFNDIVLQLSGVFDRDKWEEGGNLMVAGASGMAGAGVGRGIATAVPAAKAAIKGGSAALPAMAGYALGAHENPQALRMAGEINRKASEMGVSAKGVGGSPGGIVPPSAVFPEAAYIQDLAEVFEPTFHTQKPLRQAAEGYYEGSTRKILGEMGVAVPEGEKISEPTAAVSSRAAGQALKLRVQGEALLADTRMRAALDEAKASVAGGQAEKAGAHGMNVARLAQAAQEQREAAEKLVMVGLDDIQQVVDAAFKVAKVDGNSGELWTRVGGMFRELRRGISERFKISYRQADELTGGVKPETTGLIERAKMFLEQAPPPFRDRYPSMIAKLEKLAGKQAPDGTWLVEPHQPTFGELHEMRTMFRNEVSWYDLAPDFQQGAYKHFEAAINAALHDTASRPELAAAVKMLDETDKLYGNAIRPFNDRRIQAVMDGLRAGLPGDPGLLFNTVVKEGRPELVRKVAEMVGPNLWAAVKAADLQEMLQASRSLTEGAIDGRTFAREVLKRQRKGMLETVHGPAMTEKLLEQARYLEMLDGRLDIPVRLGDTITMAISRARAAADAAKQAAAKDPLQLLRDETQQIEQNYAKTRKALSDERKASPLNFLHNPTLGAKEAADAILKNEDLILAAAARFGEQSPEFEMLRHVYVRRFFQGTMDISKRLEAISPEVQQIMFPGVTREQMQLLAKEMDLLMATKSARLGAGESIAAKQALYHPLGPLGRYSISKVPVIGQGVDFVARTVRGEYYRLVRQLATSPAMLKWLEKGLKGDAQAQEAAREALAEMFGRAGKVGGGVGAGASETLYQGSGP